MAAEDASEVQRLAKVIAAAEKEQVPLRKQLAPLQQKATTLEESIENAGGAPLRKQKEAVAGLQKVRCKGCKSFGLHSRPKQDDGITTERQTRRRRTLDRQQLKLPCTRLKAGIADRAVPQ